MYFLSRLHSSYEDLQIGQISDTFVDFTGGVNRRIKLAVASPDLRDTLRSATYSRSLMGCQMCLGVRLSVTSNGFTAKSLSRHVCLFSASHCYYYKVSKLPHVAFWRNHILKVKDWTWIGSLLPSAPLCLGTGLSIEESLLNRTYHFPIFIKQIFWLYRWCTETQTHGISL